MSPDPEELIAEEIDEILATIERAEARLKDLTAHVNHLNGAAASISIKKPSDTNEKETHPASPARDR